MRDPRTGTRGTVRISPKLVGIYWCWRGTVRAFGDFLVLRTAPNHLVLASSGSGVWISDFIFI